MHPVAGAIEGKNNGRIDEPAGRFAQRLPRQRSRGGRIDGGGFGLEGVEEIVDGRVVAGMLGHVGEGEPTAGLDHKGAAELPRVALDTGLSAARSPRPPGRTGQLRRKQFDPAPPQARGPVGDQVGIDQQRAIEFEVFPKGLGKSFRAIADDDQFGAGLAQGWEGVTQLRDLLTAKQSTKVTNENHHRSGVGPQVTEAHRVAGVRRQLKAGQFRHPMHAGVLLRKSRPRRGALLNGPEPGGRRIEVAHRKGSPKAERIAGQAPAARPQGVQRRRPARAFFFLSIGRSIGRTRRRSPRKRGPVRMPLGGRSPPRTGRFRGFRKWPRPPRANPACPGPPPTRTRQRP